MPNFERNGLRLSYEDTGGDLPPVLLIHAFPLNSSMWEAQTESLAERYRFITPDLKGFGGSDAPEDPSVYTMDSYADELAAVLEHANVERATVVGLSIGGYIAFSLWRRHRDKVDALVLADTKAEADPPEGIEKRTNQQQMVRDEGTGGLIDALAGALLGEATLQKKPDVVARVKEIMAENPAAGFIGALESMKKRIDSTGDLTGINVPTLVIVGEHDGVTPPEAARKLHEHIEGSRLVVIPEAGHLSNLEAPEAFNGALAEFLSAL